ncbi:MAG: hypothetical protein CG444_137 [Methanosaeta sp. ASP1-2]|nr:MAG: hypothetical protein CG444_137 [Methanosaeta sp. ASP1-2]
MFKRRGRLRDHLRLPLKNNVSVRVGYLYALSIKPFFNRFTDIASCSIQRISELFLPQHVARSSSLLFKIVLMILFRCIES